MINFLVFVASFSCWHNLQFSLAMYQYPWCDYLFLYFGSILCVVLFLTWSIHFVAQVLCLDKVVSCVYSKHFSCLALIIIIHCVGTLIDGTPIINLPPKTICLSKVDFSSEERAFYSKLEADSRSQFKVIFVQFYCSILHKSWLTSWLLDHAHLN